ncbi:glyoxalase/bleomycin resistance/extradiol dioxygenase family protein [Rhizobiaceae bacterium n13]|uniref:Glyoxalase/bleomycin resistance/extradiol dioxygenase family protein n=1 Tax=Ferirhizobium litorale TaxID=2927786 RepID=A0AAE3QC05_9HYPH|nr:glyoxalase/bleomycin resistance/extradiol dioxygenase family protein [Fererhizobium litorale]MDI7860406.1 glyoxalase/bleomycin resistance/extradiol dioxygenase family protein [Fererhizobium litorale]MDI7920541.1 glyoxalase/bleomycin resistance/extradiol dioxygenase family protein [Fererhizobium litorale]
MENAVADQQPTKAEVRGGLIAYLQVDGAFKVAEFYQRAFGAEQAFAYPPDEKGRTMHVHLYINGTSLMMSDAFPEHGYPHQEPKAFTLQLVVDDIDSWWNRAVDAGCEIVTPLQVMFWGDRYGQLRDPFGISWAMNAPVKAE